MKGELIGRLLMVLVGFVLALLGVIVFIHSSIKSSLQSGTFRNTHVSLSISSQTSAGI